MGEWESTSPSPCSRAGQHPPPFLPSAAIEALTFSSQRFPAPNGRTLADIVLHEAEAARPPGFAWTLRLCSAAMQSYTGRPETGEVVVASGGGGGGGGGDETIPPPLPSPPPSPPVSPGGDGEPVPSALEPGVGYSTPSAPAAVLLTDMISRGIGSRDAGNGRGGGRVGPGRGSSGGELSTLHRLAVVATLPDRLPHALKAFPHVSTSALVSAVELCRVRRRAADAKPLLQYVG